MDAISETLLKAPFDDALPDRNANHPAWSDMYHSSLCRYAPAATFWKTSSTAHRI